MLTVKQLFIADGLDLAEDQIKLVRHVDHSNRSIQRIVAEEHFEFYQQEQSSKVRPFHDCSVILAFLGIEGNKAKFHGAYEVQGHERFTKADLKQLPEWLAEAHKDGEPRIKYQLRELEAYRSYRGRLIVQWKSTRGWHQKKDLDIYELLPATVATLFPGYQEVLLGTAATSCSRAATPNISNGRLSEHSRRRCRPVMSSASKVTKKKSTVVERSGSMETNPIQGGSRPDGLGTPRSCDSRRSTPAR